MCNFFMYYNFAMWIIDTFEIQNVSSGAVESEVLGTVVWVVIQRMTLPMIIFFRFHVFVLCIELDSMGWYYDSRRLSKDTSQVLDYNTEDGR